MARLGRAAFLMKACRSIPLFLYLAESNTIDISAFGTLGKNVHQENDLAQVRTSRVRTKPLKIYPIS